MNDKINGRTPEEIYKALRCVITQINDDCEDTCDSCKNCPNNFDGGRRELAVHLADAIVRIQQLERERDAAVKALRGVCSECIHFNSRYHPGDVMSCCKFEECVHGADDWDSEDHWQWRGVQQEDKT